MRGYQRASWGSYRIFANFKHFRRFDATWRRRKKINRHLIWNLSYPKLRQLLWNHHSHNSKHSRNLCLNYTPLNWNFPFDIGHRTSRIYVILFQLDRLFNILSSLNRIHCTLLTALPLRQCYEGVLENSDLKLQSKDKFKKLRRYAHTSSLNCQVATNNNTMNSDYCYSSVCIGIQSEFTLFC